MSSQAAATASFHEIAMYLRSGAETVFAVYTSPAPVRTGVGVLLAHSGANNFSAHRNGVWTGISRRLASEGIPSLRFDFAGTGESSGEFVLELGGQPVADATAAMDALRAAGCQRLLVVGSCFGAVPSVVASATRGDVAALILLSPPLVLAGARGQVPLHERIRGVINGSTLRIVVTNSQYRHWYFARLASLARSRMAVSLSRLGRRTRPGAPQPGVGTRPGRGLILETELARLVTTGTDVQVVYGSLDGSLARLEANLDASRAIQLLRDHRPAGLSWTVLDGSVHGFEDIAVQEELIQLVVQRACQLRE